MLRGRRILVTGGAGYIGSHAVRFLCDRGADVTVLDSLYAGHRAAVDRRASLRVGDVRDPEAVAKAMAGTEAVMHFAALSLVGESVRERERYLDVNVGGTTCLAREAARQSVRAFVLSSTAATYGEDVALPITERQARRPCNPYGESKVAAEDVLSTAPFPAVFLRYFNAAGAMPDGSIGEDHRTETHLIPLAIAAATGRRPPLTVFGADWPTPDGTCVRDYVHVLDLVDAHLLALEHLLGGRGGGAFNLGTGTGSSVREVLRAVGEAMGVAVPHFDGPRRDGDPPSLVASPQKARDVLGWTATRDLRTITEDAWRWHRNHPDGYDD